MSYEEFLVWADGNVYAEWVEGEARVYMSNTADHERLLRFLAQLLGLFVDLFDLGEIFTSNLQMKLKDGSGRQPDVLFVAKHNRGRLLQNRLDGPADLVIEIVSDESVIRDREDKFYEYEAAGIPEHWILDPRPNRQRVYFYRLNEAGRYQPVAADNDGLFHSAVLPGFWLKVDWLWQEPFPEALRSLAEIAGRERVIAFLAKQ